MATKDGDAITRIGAVDQAGTQGQIRVQAKGEVGLSYGDRVEWLPGPRASRNAKGKITKYEHPFLHIQCDDGQARKVRPGAVTKQG